MADLNVLIAFDAASRFQCVQNPQGGGDVEVGPSCDLTQAEAAWGRLEHLEDVDGAGEGSHVRRGCGRFRHRGSI